MSDITEYEAQQIKQANASKLTPVVFIHGLWLLPSSWDRWRRCSRRQAMPPWRRAGLMIPTPSRMRTGTPRSSPAKVSGRSPITSAT